MHNEPIQTSGKFESLRNQQRSNMIECANPSSQAKYFFLLKKQSTAPFLPEVGK